MKLTALCVAIIFGSLTEDVCGRPHFSRGGWLDFRHELKFRRLPELVPQYIPKGDPLEWPFPLAEEVEEFIPDCLKIPKPDNFSTTLPNRPNNGADTPGRPRPNDNQNDRAVTPWKQSNIPNNGADTPGRPRPNDNQNDSAVTPRPPKGNQDDSKNIPRQLNDNQDNRKNREEQPGPSKGTQTATNIVKLNNHQNQSDKNKVQTVKNDITLDNNQIQT